MQDGFIGIFEKAGINALSPFYYPSGKTGLFGLIATGGALVAPYFRKLADKGSTYKSLVITVSLIICSILLIKLFPFSIPIQSKAELKTIIVRSCNET